MPNATTLDSCPAEFILSAAAPGESRKGRTSAGTAETPEPPGAGTCHAALYRLCGNDPADITRGQASSEDIEELTADVFLALWHHAPEMRTEHLTGYLASIARSKGCNWLRKRQLDTQPIDDVVVAADTDISAQAEQAEIVREVMGLLPEQDREILMRYYFYRQTVSEIAGELHMKESTVKTRMYRSRKKLRQLFTERGYGYEQMELV